MDDTNLFSQVSKSVILSTYYNDVHEQRANIALNALQEEDGQSESQDLKEG